MPADTCPSMADPADDRQLWERVRRGDPAALGELFARHARAVRAFCFRRTADLAVADELASVVFLEAWRLRATTLQRPSALPFLLGIATNVVRNERRARRRHRAALERLPAAASAPDHASDADARVDAERRAGDVLAALRRLPRHEQDVLVLCLWMDLSYEDAATALGVPIGTVRSRLSRARARMRAALPDEVPGPRPLCAPADD